MRITIENLDPGSIYATQFQAVSGEQVSEWSNNFYIETISDEEPPTVPTLISFVLDEDTFVASWSPIDTNIEQNYDFDSYQVQFTAPGGQFIIRTTSNLQYTLSTLENSAAFGSLQQELTAKVRAYDNTGNYSAWSNEISVTVATPQPPTGLVVTSTAGAANLVWNESASGFTTGYNVYYGNSPQPSTNKLTTKSDNMVIVLDNGTYYFTVTATDKFGRESNPVYAGPINIEDPFELDTTPPAAPTNVSVSTSFDNIAQKSYLDVSWTASVSDDVQFYQISYQESGKNASFVMTGEDNSNARFEVAKGVSYTVKVRAIDYASNASAFVTASGSPITSAVDTTPPGKVFGVNMVTEGWEFIASWDAVVDSDLAFYRVRASDGTVTKTYQVSDTNWNLNYQQNVSAFGTAKPSITITVAAVDYSGNEGELSSAVNAQVAVPEPPTNLVTSVGANTISLTWTASPSVITTKYYVYRGTSANPTTKISEISGTSFVDSVDTTTYYYSIRAADAKGRTSTALSSGALTATDPYTRDTTPPATPTGLAATLTNNANGIGGKAQVTWTNPTATDLAGTQLQYRETGQTNWYSIFNGPDITAVTVDLPKAYVGYQFRIRSFDIFNNYSGFSSTLSKTAVANTAPGNVSGVTLDPQITAITAKWNAVSDADLRHYEIQIASNSGFTNNLVTVYSNSTTATLAGLEPKSTYYVRVRAVDNAGLTSAAWSTTASTTTKAYDETDGLAPSASPTPVVTGGFGYLHASWSPVANADPVTYDVYMDDSSGFALNSNTLVGSTTGTNMNILTNTAVPELQPDTTYYVKIVARDADGAAAAGGQANATTKKAQAVDLDVDPREDFNVPRVFIQPSPPTAGESKVDDIWFDDNDQMHEYYYNGSAWVSVRDGSIAVAQTAANNAQSTADEASIKADEARGQNMVQNSSFVYGNTRGWLDNFSGSDASVYRTDIGRTDNYSLELNSGTFRKGHFIGQVVKDQILRIGFWMKADVAGTTLNMPFGFVDGENTNWIGQNVFEGSSVTLADDQWTYFEHDWISPGEYNNLHLRFAGSVTSGGPRAYIDDISVVDVTVGYNAQATADSANEAAIYSADSGAITKNSAFGLWESGLPVNWNGASNAPAASQETSDVITKPYALKFTNTGGNNTWVYGDFNVIPTLQYVTVTSRVMLKSGALSGSGILVRWVQDNGAGGFNDSFITFQGNLEETVDVWQDIKVTIPRPSGFGSKTLNNLRIFAMANWSSMGALTDKTIVYDNITVAQATQAEVEAYEAQANLDAAYAELNGFIGDKGKVYFQTNAPAGDYNSLWVDTTNGDNIPHQWNGSAWVPVSDAGIQAAANAAAQAQSSADDAYELGREGIESRAQNTNPNFLDYPSGGLPTGYASWNSAPFRESTITRTGGYAARFNVNTNSGGMKPSGGGSFDSVPDSEYIMVEVDFYLVSGSLGAAGVLIDWKGYNGSYIRTQYSLGLEFPSPEFGKWYKFAKVFKRPTITSGSFTGLDGYLMANYNALGTLTAKDIVFDKWAVRAATRQEIEAYEAKGYTDSRETVINNKINTDVAAALSSANTYTDNQVSTAANGKNKIVRSTATPSGTNYIDGDIWYRYSGSNVIGMWFFSGGSWVSQTLRNEVIATLDAAKINTGLLDADRIGARSIEVEKLIIANFNNEFANPDFSATPWDAGWTNSGAVSYTSSTVFSGNTVGTTARLIGPSKSIYSPLLHVEPGEQYDFRAVIHNAENGSNSRFWITTYDKSGGNSAVWINEPFPTTSGWSDYDYQFTIPNNAYYINFTFLNNSSAPADGDFYFTNLNLRRKSEGRLIVDGSVEAKALKTSTLDAAVITLASGGTIKSADFVSGSAGWSLSNGGLQVNSGTVDAKVLKAGTAIANNLSVTSTLTIGTGSNTGYIQSFGFNSTTGFQLSKTGLTIRGSGNAIDAAAMTTGVLNAARVRVGSGTTFDSNYNPLDKVNTTAYSASNTGASLSGQWTLLTRATMSGQYSNIDYDLVVAGGASGDTAVRYADLHVRVKQQNAFGNNPHVDITYKDGRGFTSDDFVAVILQNSGPSIVELYARTTSSYDAPNYTPINLNRAGGQTIQFLENQGYIATLPAGTQVGTTLRGASKIGALTDGWTFTGTTEINGGAIRTDTIDVGAIQSGSVWTKTLLLGTASNGGVIQSYNYSPGSTGWRIGTNSSGQTDLEINQGVIKIGAVANLNSNLNGDWENNNYNFRSWTGTYPDATGYWSSGADPVKETSIVRTGGNAVRFISASDTENKGLDLYSASDRMMRQVTTTDYLTVELVFYLVSGGLGGSGLLIDFIGGNSVRQGVNLSALVPNVQTGRWYKVTQTLKTGTSGPVTNYNGWLMGNWSTHLGTRTAKDIIFDSVGIRAATTAEIDAFNASGDLSAQVSYLEGYADTAASNARSGALVDVKSLWGHASDSTTIDGNKIFTGSIYTTKLVVGDSNNYAPGGGFDTTEHYNQWTRSGDSSRFSIDTTETNGSKGALKVAPSGSNAGLITVVAGNPGDKIIVRWDQKMDANWNGTSSWSKLRFHDYDTDEYLGATTFNNTQSWTGQAVEFTFNTGRSRIGVQWAFDHSAGNAWIDNASIQKKSNGEVIIDGTLDVNALKTSTLTSTTITLGSGGIFKTNNNAVQITDTGITVTSGASGGIAAEKISVGGIGGTGIQITGSAIQSSNFGASNGFQLSSTGLIIRQGEVSASVLKAGTIGSSTGVITVASGASLVFNGGYLKSNSYSGTSYSATAGTGWYLGNDGLRIAQGAVSASALTAGTISGTNTITLSGANAKIVGTGFSLSGSGLTVTSGSIQGAALIAEFGNGNMVTNGSFSAYPDKGYGWTVTNGTASVGYANSGILSGPYAGYVQLSNGETDTFFQSDGIRLQSGQKYTASARVYKGAAGTATSSQNGWALAVFHNGTNYTNTFRADTKVATTFAAMPAGDYVRLYVTFTATANADAYVKLYAGASGNTINYGQVKLEEGEFPSGYSPKPDEILPGTIQGDMVRANTIDADVLKANTAINQNLNVTSTLTIGGGANSGVIRSKVYTQGSVGWAINYDGSAEFNNVTVRGTLDGVGGTFDGELTAATGSFNGAITAQSGSITGNFDIASGGILRVLGDGTAAKIEIDSQYMKGYNTSGQQVWLASANSGAFYFGQNNDVVINNGNINLSGNNASITAPGFTLNNSGLTIDGSLATVDGASFNNVIDTSSAEYSSSTAGARTPATVNPTFNDWTGTYPDGWSAWNGSGQASKETTRVLTGRYAVRMNCTASDCGYNDSTAFSNIPYSQYYAIEADVYIESFDTDLQGAGIILDIYRTGGSYNRELMLLSQEIPNPIAGRWYRVIKIVKDEVTTPADFTGCQGYLMANWTGMGTRRAKNIVWDRVGVREATPNEAEAYEASRRVDLWTYPGTTNITGGLIQTNTVSAETLKAGTTITQQLNVTNSLIVGGGANSGLIRSQTYTPNSDGWQINYNGSAEFNDVTVRGTVYATSGSFTGSVTATSGTFTGTIHAGGGTITGDLNMSGSGRINVNGTGGARIQITSQHIIGYNTGGSESFRLNGTNGNITTGGMTIGGGTLTVGTGIITGTGFTLNSSGLTVTSGTITGALVRTSSSGYRVEITGDMVKGYTGLSGESPSEFDPYVILSNRASLVIRGGRTGTYAYTPRIAMVASANSAGVVTGPAHRLSEVGGDLYVNAETISINNGDGFVSMTGTGTSVNHDVAASISAPTTLLGSTSGSTEIRGTATISGTIGANINMNSNWIQNVARLENTSSDIVFNVANGIGRISSGGNVKFRVGMNATGSAITFNTSWAAATTDTMNASTPSSGNTVDFYCNTLYRVSQTTLSDQREKSGIIDVAESESLSSRSPLEAIKGIKIREFYFNSDSSKKRRIGVIAQEVMETLPQAVGTTGFAGNDDEERYNVNYDDLYALNIAATQELATENERLKAKNEALEARMTELENMVRSLAGMGK